MKIEITTKNISLDEPLRNFVEDKIGGLEHLVGNDKGEAKVEIGKPSKHHRHGFVFLAKVDLKLGSRVLRAESSHVDLRTAITEAKDELQTQIKKFKEKRKDLSRQPKE